MPEGRFVSRSIAYSEQVASVSFEADYLFGRMLIFADREGRITGSPHGVKGMCCPLRAEMTPEVIERGLSELAAARLIVWYRVEESRYVFFPGFRNHQRGAHLDREAASRHPAPDGEGSVLLPESRRTNSGAGPAKVRVSKVKRSKAKRREEAPATPAGDLGGAKKRPPRETWVTPFANVWEELYGGRMPIDPNLRPLKEAVDKLGADEALRRWEIYLCQNPGRFASAARFASTLNEWQIIGKPADGKIILTSVRVKVTPENRARAEVLFGLGRQHHLLKFEGNRAQYGAAKKRAEADPLAGATFDADFKAAKLWEGLADLDERTAVNEIARRLELAHANGNGNGNGAKAEAKIA